MLLADIAQCRAGFCRTPRFGHGLATVWHNATRGTDREQSSFWAFDGGVMLHVKVGAILAFDGVM